MEKNNISVMISYALPQQQWVKTLSVKNGSTVAEVLKQAESSMPFATIDISQHKIGIFGKVVELSHLVQENDRIEIYRPLICDPKSARRARAEVNKKKK